MAATCQERKSWPLPSRSPTTTTTKTTQTTCSPLNLSPLSNTTLDPTNARLSLRCSTSTRPNSMCSRPAEVPLLWPTWTLLTCLNPPSLQRMTAELELTASYLDLSSWLSLQPKVPPAKLTSNSTTKVTLLETISKWLLLLQPLSCSHQTLEKITMDLLDNNNT